MKLLVSWIFDHIDGASWKSINISDLINQFNTTTAEVDSCNAIQNNFETFSIAQVMRVSTDFIELIILKSEQTIQLPVRADAEKKKMFLIKKENDSYQWLRLTDFHSTKDGLFPAISASKQAKDHELSKILEASDYILEIDNKSITHRPDLWSHRGVAREIAAILDLKLVPEKKLLAKIPIKHAPLFMQESNEFPFSIRIDAPEACKRFAGFFIPKIRVQDSWISMAYRLSCVDARPINAIVDATNYVMFDIGQPLHAFNAKKITSKAVIPRFAQEGEHLTLLDEQDITLQSTDLVISDGAGAESLALAGIMGGKSSSVQHDTTELFVESACFDATTIRRSALHHKIRTEASARFEKSLDPFQNTKGLQRLVALLKQNMHRIRYGKYIVSLGQEQIPLEIPISHAFLESRIGCKIDSKSVIEILKKLSFLVRKRKKAGVVEYLITVPSFRVNKDITQPEDIVEEIVRFWGYKNIPMILPLRRMDVRCNEYLDRIEFIKRLCAYHIQAREVANYSVFDESFLEKIDWQPHNAVHITNPVSLLWQRLVTTLIPHLFKNLLINKSSDEVLRFFEYARIWDKNNGNIREQKVLAGLLFDHKSINFYHEKERIATLFEALHMDVAWQKASVSDTWYHPYQTAHLIFQDRIIGTFGKVNEAFMERMLSGDALIFQLDAEILLTVQEPQYQYKQIPKYPSALFDVSMFVPLEQTVAQVTHIIKSVDERIIAVRLIDFFEKDEWHDKRSLTMRTVLQDQTKTLEKDDINAIHERVMRALELQAQAMIR